MRTSETIYDEFLILRAQDGEADALDQLVRRWHPRLLASAMRRTGDAEGARDVAQEAWGAIVRGIPRLDDPSRFPGWAMRIIANKSADWVGSRGRDRRGTPRASPDPNAADTAPDPEVDALRLALRTLDPDTRLILAFAHARDMSTREIAAALSIPEGTVKSRLHSARARLRAAIERTSHEPV